MSSITKTNVINLTEEEFVHPGNRACTGCGLSILYRIGMKALGRDCIFVVPPSCLTVLQGLYPISATQMPVLNCTFASTAAIATGVRAARSVPRGNEKPGRVQVQVEQIGKLFRIPGRSDPVGQNHDIVGLFPTGKFGQGFVAHYGQALIVGPDADGIARDEIDLPLNLIPELIEVLPEPLDVYVVEIYIQIGVLLLQDWEELVEGVL